jgi:flagellin-like hook-associated protein FlgL
MASNITLSASVRKNLLALQSTADLASLTQNRLATGKKVNSALDNPGNFFTSQSLNNRAGDLNSLLDSIGQAQQTLKAADEGITSLTKLVESAKSIAKQARQAPQPGSATYSAIALSGNPTDEALGTTGNGTAITVANATTYSFDININGAGAETVTYTSDADATYAEILAGLQGSFATALTASGVTAADAALVANAGGDGIRVNALTADTDFVVSANTGAGLTNNTYNSTSLLDNIVTAGGTAGDTLTVAVNGGANNVITFGTGSGQISTLAELQSTLNTISGLTGTASSSAITFNVASSSSQNSISLTSSSAGLTTALGASAITGTTQGTASVGAADPTRTSLQADYNNVLEQIDALAGDASYNGVNLLAGDDLKVVFNENGTSSLTITGVTFDASGLGLSEVSGAGFQSDGDIDATIETLDTALATLRTQSSKFGSNLTTVQTRQDFTKNLINTLQTGADNLVLADTNEEGANLLALQTRQQLSSTALSLSAQADQAVLRLFG